MERASKTSLLIDVPYYAPRTGPRQASAGHAPVAQDKTRAAGAADAIAEIICRGPRVGADPHLIEQAAAAGAEPRTQQARILVADHGAEPLHRTGVHRQRLVAVEAGRQLHAPSLCGREGDMLFEAGDERIGRALEQRH